MAELYEDSEGEDRESWLGWAIELGRRGLRAGEYITVHGPLKFFTVDFAYYTFVTRNLASHRSGCCDGLHIRYFCCEDTRTQIASER